MKWHFVNFAGKMGMEVKNGILSNIFRSQDLSKGDLYFPFHAEWISPSNIALVKYWGKKKGQLPANPSLSMTLSKAVTRTVLTVHPVIPGKMTLTVNGSPDHAFVPKLSKLLQWMMDELPVLRDFSFDIRTANTFPHSAGIASSASGISAFALCMLTFISGLTGVEIPSGDFCRLASFVARMGSGSASRSVYGGFSLWGETPLVENSSDLYAVSVNESIHGEFADLRDAILIISSRPKSLSSSTGHDLMNNHPFAGIRYALASENLVDILSALRSGDYEKLASAAENEALTLHGLIMSSKGGGILLEPGSVAVIHKVRNARAKGIPVFFTIDAGPNIHLLYPSRSKEKVEKFIREDLAEFCGEGMILYDECGQGPVKGKQTQA